VGGSGFRTAWDWGCESDGDVGGQTESNNYLDFFFGEEGVRV
jgi:hypothetical protein